MNAVMQQFVQRLEEALGLHYAEKDWGSLEKKMEGAAAEFGFNNASDCIHYLAGRTLSAEDATKLAKHLTIGETYFFRDLSLFRALKEKIFPELIEKRIQKGRYLRIWSAACCSGEEPYSLAILLSELIPDISSWDIVILGSDINPNFLEKASKGIYKKWSMRTTSPEVLHRYFKIEKGDQYHIAPGIQKLVKFIPLNLIEDQYPSQDMDLIICNNVLIYFSPETIHKTIKKLGDALVEGGHLVVSSTEVPFVENEKLVLEQIGDSTFFRKGAPVKKQKPQHKEIRKKATKPVHIPVSRPKPPEVNFTELYEGQKYDEIIRAYEKTNGKIRERDLVPVARTYANKGDLETAKKLMEQILVKEKLDPELQFFYGTLNEELGLLDEAVKAYKKALFLDHNFVIGYYALGNVLAAQGDTQEALRNFRNAERLLEKMDDEAYFESKGITATLLKEIISSHQKSICSNK